MRDLLPQGYFAGYEPSMEPGAPEPTSISFEGYHNVLAVDVRRGDLFSHPHRNGKFFPVNSRVEGLDEYSPFVRLEYIDVYEMDQPVTWIPTPEQPADPNVIMREGFDYTPSGGLASVTFDADQWVLIKNRPTVVGKVVKTTGTPMSGAQQRYQWFFDHDVYTYNLLESMYVIGVTSNYYPDDPHYTDFMGGGTYLDLANAYLHASGKSSTGWEAPATPGPTLRGGGGRSRHN